MVYSRSPEGEVCVKAVFTKDRLKGLFSKDWFIAGACGVGLALVTPAVLFTTGGAGARGMADAVVIIDQGTIAQGVYIGEHDVSGMDGEQALALLRADANKTLTLVLPDHHIQVPTAALGASPQPLQAVEQALGVGRKGGADARKRAIETAKREGIAVCVPYAFEKDGLREAVLAVSDGISRESVAGAFTFDPSLPERFLITPGARGFTPDNEALIERVEAALLSGEIANVEVPGEPSGAPIEGDSTEQTLMNTTLAGAFTTKVGGSSGRVSNIKTAAELINGAVVKPGEIFSVNDCLGPRTKAAGIWKKAPAIAGGEIEEQLGGGICQVSTTLFNAVARADLKIVEWRHHSIPSSYVKIGCDAAINTGGPDFKFKNDTQWPVYIVFVYDSATRELLCEIWGRPLPDGMTIDIVGKQTGSVAIPQAVVTTNASAASKGRAGKSSRTYKVYYDADGNELRREQISRHYYPAKAPVVYMPEAEAPKPDGDGATPPGDGGAAQPPDEGGAE
jgi:vancomycin resistance protein YoaR